MLVTAGEEWRIYLADKIEGRGTNLSPVVISIGLFLRVTDLDGYFWANREEERDNGIDVNLSRWEVVVKSSI